MLADAFTKELDEGESQVIALALETNPGLILLDEITVRMTAESYQIPFTGSIGCLVEAKRNRIISEIRPLLDEMRIKAGFWINPKLYQKILHDNNE
ncbi:MAG: DUF3368 domain-containing protein [Desulfobacterales bacterium]